MKPAHRRKSATRRRRTAVAVGAVVAAAAIAGAVVALTGSGSPSHRVGTGATSVVTSPASTAGPTASSAAPTTSTTSTTVAPPTTTTAKTPGELPQTNQLPSGTDPAFLARVSDIWQAVVSGNTATAQPAFIPQAAYAQIRSTPGYQTQLIPYFDHDLTALHDQVRGGSATATFVQVTVPNTATQVAPASAGNQAGYWRVDGAKIYFREAGAEHYFSISEMISWRGQWYVLYLSSIR